MNHHWHSNCSFVTLISLGFPLSHNYISLVHLCLCFCCYCELGFICTSPTPDYQLIENVFDAMHVHVHVHVVGLDESTLLLRNRGPIWL
jgi:hypothetical protein